MGGIGRIAGHRFGNIRGPATEEITCPSGGFAEIRGDCAGKQIGEDLIFKNHFSGDAVGIGDGEALLFSIGNTVAVAVLCPMGIEGLAGGKGMAAENLHAALVKPALKEVPGSDRCGQLGQLLILGSQAGRDTDTAPGVQCDGIFRFRRLIRGAEGSSRGCFGGEEIIAFRHTGIEGIGRIGGQPLKQRAVLPVLSVPAVLHSLHLLQGDSRAGATEKHRGLRRLLGGFQDGEGLLHPDALAAHDHPGRAGVVVVIISQTARQPPVGGCIHGIRLDRCAVGIGEICPGPGTQLDPLTVIAFFAGLDDFFTLGLILIVMLTVRIAQTGIIGGRDHRRQEGSAVLIQRGAVLFIMLPALPGGGQNKILNDGAALIVRLPQRGDLGHAVLAAVGIVADHADQMGALCIMEIGEALPLMVIGIRQIDTAELVIFIVFRSPQRHRMGRARAEEGIGHDDDIASVQLPLHVRRKGFIAALIDMIGQDAPAEYRIEKAAGRIGGEGRRIVSQAADMSRIAVDEHIRHGIRKTAVGADLIELLPQHFVHRAGGGILSDGGRIHQKAVGKIGQIREAGIFRGICGIGLHILPVIIQPPLQRIGGRGCKAQAGILIDALAEILIDIIPAVSGQVFADIVFLDGPVVLGRGFVHGAVDQPEIRLLHRDGAAVCQLSGHRGGRNALRPVNGVNLIAALWDIAGDVRRRRSLDRRCHRQEQQQAQQARSKTVSHFFHGFSPYSQVIRWVSIFYFTKSRQ